MSNPAAHSPRWTHDRCKLCQRQQRREVGITWSRQLGPVYSLDVAKNCRASEQASMKDDLIDVT